MGGAVSHTKEKTVEIVDLENKNGEQKKKCGIPQLPVGTIKHQSVATSNSIITCGGLTDPNGITSSCWRLMSSQNDKWEHFPNMKSKRAFFGMTMLKDTLYAVGGSNDGTNTMESIGVEKSDAEWQYKKTPPVSLSQHCTVKISETELISIGGLQNGRVSQ